MLEGQDVVLALQVSPSAAALTDLVTDKLQVRLLSEHAQAAGCGAALPERSTSMRTGTADLQEQLDAISIHEGLLVAGAGLQQNGQQLAGILLVAVKLSWSHTRKQPLEKLGALEHLLCDLQTAQSTLLVWPAAVPTECL